MSKVETAVEKVREALHDACKDMPPEDYYAVLQEISADMDGNIEALKEENPELG